MDGSGLQQQHALSRSVDSMASKNFGIKYVPLILPASIASESAEILPTYYNGSKAIIPTVNIFNHDCNFYDNATLNQAALDQVCAEFQDIGCCFGNNVAMMAQSQTNTSSILIIIYQRVPSLSLAIS